MAVSSAGARGQQVRVRGRTELLGEPERVFRLGQRAASEDALADAGFPRALEDGGQVA
jgi:hypothetical protein